MVKYLSSIIFASALLVQCVPLDNESLDSSDTINSMDTTDSVQYELSSEIKQIVNSSTIYGSDLGNGFGVISNIGVLSPEDYRGLSELYWDRSLDDYRQLRRSITKKKKIEERFEEDECFSNLDELTIDELVSSSGKDSQCNKDVSAWVLAQKEWLAYGVSSRANGLVGFCNDIYEKNVTLNLSFSDEMKQCLVSMDVCETKADENSESLYAQELLQLKDTKDKITDYAEQMRELDTEFRHLCLMSDHLPEIMVDPIVGANCDFRETYANPFFQELLYQ
jgi:hypothetical protein